MSFLLFHELVFEGAVISKVILGSSMTHASIKKNNHNKNNKMILDYRSLSLPYPSILHLSPLPNPNPKANPS